MQQKQFFYTIILVSSSFLLLLGLFLAIAQPGKVGAWLILVILMPISIGHSIFRIARIRRQNRN